MKEKLNEATIQRPDGNYQIDSPHVFIDLPLFLKKLKTAPAWHYSDRNAITVFKTPGMRIVLIALHEGAEIDRYAAHGIINVQVLEGSIQFITGMQPVELFSGQMLVLHERIPYSVRATSDTVFLLTLATSFAVN